MINEIFYNFLKLYIITILKTPNNISQHWNFHLFVSQNLEEKNCVFYWFNKWEFEIKKLSYYVKVIKSVKKLIKHPQTAGSLSFHWIRWRFHTASRVQVWWKFSFSRVRFKIFPLYFRVIALVRKSDLFPCNYVGSEIRKSGITSKTE